LSYYRNKQLTLVEQNLLGDIYNNNFPNFGFMNWTVNGTITTDEENNVVIIPTLDLYNNVCPITQIYSII